jgi:NAD(P)-dependent dehydrogenase (short-subunit alcohol dehydrogenase family)
MEQQMEPTNKIALITGGSRGLGRDMALRLAEKGNDVLITYQSKADEAAAVVQAIQEMGRKAAALQLDAGNVAGFDAFTASVKDTLQRTFGTVQFHFLVNNAGFALYAPFAETTEVQFDEIMNVHFKGVFFLTQKLLPQIADGGRVINIGSGLDRFCYAGSSAYGSMKGAIETLSRYMALELGPRQINVNVVAPGAIETDFGGGHVRDNAEINQRIAGITALGRVGKPDDIGGVVAFLCSDDAKWVNGQRIEVSGGIYL